MHTPPPIPRQLLGGLTTPEVARSAESSQDLQIGQSEEQLRAKGLEPVSFDAYLMAAGINRRQRRRIAAQLTEAQRQGREPTELFRATQGARIVRKASR